MDLDALRRHAKALGFEPQDSVRWLSPRQLVRTGVKVGLSELLADFGDRREIQGSLPSESLRAPLRDPDAAGELWLDFVADVGDGFDSAYTVAWLLGRDQLEVPEKAASGEPLRLPRGSLLVFGGDEVYPTPSARGYADRMRGPYRCALPAADDDPLLVALPGNHDWYDGLTTFLRTFGQKRKVGAWRTQQTRSYFAVQLPNKWWLLGLDTQLGTYIDGPQLAYFEEHVTSKLRPGDGVIICSASPTWVKAATEDVDAFDSLHWFDRQFIRTRRVPGTDEREETHASVRLWITGDSHHYTRFAERLPSDLGDPAPDPRRRQLVTCGLGGAYLTETHTLPDELHLPPSASRLYQKDTPPPIFTRMPSTTPDPVTSRRLAWRLASPWSKFWLPRRNPGFATLAAGLQVALYFVASFLFGLTQGKPPSVAVREGGVAAVGLFAVEAMAVVVVAALAPWFVGRVRGRRWRGPSTAVLAVCSQALVPLVLLAIYAMVPWPASWPDWLVLTICVLVTVVLGSVLCCEVFALFVLVSKSSKVAEWQLAGQAIGDVKGFVRMHIADSGDLTLYPLVVDEVCHDWALVQSSGGPVVPRPSEEPVLRLIEDPIVVSRTAGSAHADG